MTFTITSSRNIILYCRRYLELYVLSIGFLRFSKNEGYTINLYNLDIEVVCLVLISVDGE